MDSDVQLEKEKRWLIDEKYGGRVTAKNRAAVERDIERLKKNEPVDYVIGFVDFAGCKIDLSLHPLIPRAETEYWTEKAIDDLLNDPRIAERRALRCLDMFAGSGCVGIAFLKHVPFVTVDFAEKEDKFLEQIKINLRLNKIDKARRRVIKSDVFSNIPGSYDYIFANPPYIAVSAKKDVQESVLEWEPASALFGGENGLMFIEEFLKNALSHLNAGGKLYMEFNDDQEDDIKKILDHYGYGEYDFFRDQFGKWRYLSTAALEGRADLR